MAAPLKIAMLAGEVSGDQLGGWLMQSLKQRRSDIQFVGLGGDNMRAQGLDPIFPIRDIALIGIAEILPHVRTITRRIRETVEFLEREKPDMIISIDVPGFALRVLKQLHANGRIRPKLVHYVAPTVWAYRPERAKIVAERYDALLCLLPFEPPYFEGLDLQTHYIGHEIAWFWKERGDGAAFRTAHNIGADTPLLAVFPGSRRGEIKRLWPVFKSAIEKLKADIPALEVVIQVPTDLMPRMQAATKNWQVKAHILPNTTDKKNLFAAATAALVKSGTIALECALAGLPSITTYKANPLSVYMLRKMIKVAYVNLANILAGKMVVPELLQENCTPDKLSSTLLPLLTDANARAAQQAELTKISEMLGTADATSPSEKAADLLLAMLD